MAHIRGTAGYNLGAQDNRFGGPGRADATNDPSPLDQIREQTSKIEDWLDTISDPLKPYVYPVWDVLGDLARTKGTPADQTWQCRYLPMIGRFLIVVTFLEDALRILTQWSDQLIYLKDYRHSMLLRPS